MKFLLEKNEKIVAVSRGVEEDVRQALFLNPSKIEVICNPIDAEEVRKKAESPLREGEGKIFEKPVLINISRFVEQKGLLHLIEIFRLIKDALKEINLLLIGDGPLRGEIEKRIKQLGLESSVFLTGWRENPFPYLKRSKLFPMTSLWGRLPMVLLESMALGVPPLAFKTRGGQVEVLENCCPLIEFPDKEAYARRVVKLLKDETEYEKLRRRVTERVEEFLPERVAEKYLSLAKNSE